MDRHLIAYRLIGVLVAALAAWFAWSRYHSRANMLRRRKHSDAARWEARARRGPDADSGES